MSLKGIRTRWLVAPLAALFLLFSTGAAATPECHFGSTAKPTNNSEVVNSHAGHSHSHSTQVTSGAVSISEEAFLAAGSMLSKEFCAVVGFIVLLLLRFTRTARSALTTKQFSPPRYQLSLFLAKNLGYLNLTHLKLGIIRI